ncbi:MAG: U32 family peptidase [Rhodospirillales bacterium]|nr:U32 family peptidase [Rhodospirillales bacterium]
MTDIQRCSELLLPAGSLEKLKIAVLYGADAVYLGTPDLSLRTKSEFTLEEVVEGVEFAHKYGKRVYLTLNLFSHNKDIDKLPDYVDTVRKVQPDGLIVADPGVFMFVKERAPELDLHVSTQANVCSWQSVKFWQDQGASLCVLGREVSFNELTEIREKCPNIKLEAFIHGAMCMTYSGRCLLSNFMAERGANQGACANSCRWKYKVHMRLKDGTSKELPLTEENLELFEFLLEEEIRPGEFMPIEEDDRGSYILNSKDLCIMPKLDDILRIGVDSLKVEGRGKSIYYVALVARAYRMAIDDWYNDPENWSAEDYMDELLTIPNRGYTYAFHEGRLTNHSHGYENTATLGAWEYAGIVQSVGDDAFIIEGKNKLEASDVLEFVPPNDRDTILLRLYEFEHAKTGEIRSVINGGHDSYFRVPFAVFDQEDLTTLKDRIPPMTVLRKERSLTEVQWDRIKLDTETHAIEAGKESVQAYTNKRDRLRESQALRDTSLKVKTPRIGMEGCCGKGCNGCLMFWHDPSYARARELLAEKKQGELFDQNMKDKPADKISA